MIVLLRGAQSRRASATPLRRCLEKKQGWKNKRLEGPVQAVRKDSRHLFLLTCVPSQFARLGPQQSSLSSFSFNSVSDLPTYSGGKAEQEAVYTAARRAPGPLLTVVGRLRQPFKGTWRLLNRRRPLSPSQFRSVLPMNGRISVLGLVVAALFGCDGSMQTVSLTAEDFRFTPDLVRVRASAPVTLSVYNAGREVHEFDSAILMYAAKTSLPKETPESASTPGIVIRPGQSLRVVMAPPAGTYLYICRRKGHANMTGTLIVE